MYLISIYVKLPNYLYHCLNYGFMGNKEYWFLLRSPMPEGGEP